MPRFLSSPLLAVVLLTASSLAGSTAMAQLPLEVVTPPTDLVIEFDKDIQPLLQRNCVACHQAQEAEAGLVLESHAALLKGGDSGPGVVAKEPDVSLVLLRATGREEPLMPPEDNDVGAQPLSPEQLGLLQRWIEQGAQASTASPTEAIAWQGVPGELQPIYALATSRDGRFAVIGRGNRVAVYDLRAGVQVTQLVDADLPSEFGTEAADRDLIQSVAIAPDGRTIATGGFRTVKLWRAGDRRVSQDTGPYAAAAGPIAASPDGEHLAVVNAVDDIEIRNRADNQLLRTLSHGGGAIVGLAWMAFDGSLVSADSRGRLTVWDARSGALRSSFDAQRVLRRFTAANDGHWLAAIDSHRRVSLWHADPKAGEGQPAFTAVAFPAIDKITDATAVTLLSQPQPRLVIGTENGAILAIDLRKGQAASSVEHGAPVTALAVSADDKVIVSAGADGKARLWNAADGKTLLTCQQEPAQDTDVAKAQRDADRQQAAVKRMAELKVELEKRAASETEAQAKAQTERDTAAKALTDAKQQKEAASAAVVASEAALAKATADHAAASKTVSDAASKASAAEAKAEAEAEKKPVAGGAEAAGGDAGGTDANADHKAAIEAKQKAESEAKRTAEDQAKRDAESKAKQEAESQAMAAAVAEAAERLKQSTAEVEKQRKTVADAEKAVQEKETALQQQERILKTAMQVAESAATVLANHAAELAHAQHLEAELVHRLANAQQRHEASQSAVVAVAVREDGGRVAVAHIDGRLRLYDTADGMLLDQLESDRASVDGVTYLDDALLCTYGRQTQATVWSLAPRWDHQKTIGTPEASPLSDRVTAVDFRPDGRSLAVGGGPPSRFGEMHLFATDGGKPVRDYGHLHGDCVLSVRFSPDGRILACSGADNTIRLVDVATGEVQRVLEGHTHHVLAVAWQDDGQSLASASADLTVKLWEPATGQQQRTITGFPKEVTALAFISTTSQLATACADGQLRLYDATNGRSVRTFGTGSDYLYALAAGAGGKTVVAGGQDGVLRVWNISDGKLLHEWK